MSTSKRSRPRAPGSKKVSPGKLTAKQRAEVDRLEEVWKWVIEARAGFRGDIRWLRSRIAKADDKEAQVLARALRNVEGEQERFARLLLPHTKRHSPPFALRGKYRDGPGAKRKTNRRAMKGPRRAPQPLKGSRRDEQLYRAYKAVLACRSGQAPAPGRILLDPTKVAADSLWFTMHNLAPDVREVPRANTVFELLAEAIASNASAKLAPHEWAVETVARFLGVSPTTVRRAITQEKAQKHK